MGTSTRDRAWLSGTVARPESISGPIAAQTRLGKHPVLVVSKLVVLPRKRFPQPRHEISKEQVRCVVWHELVAPSPEVLYLREQSLLPWPWKENQGVTFQAFFLRKKSKDSLTLASCRGVLNCCDARGNALFCRTSSSVTLHVKPGVLRQAGDVESVSEFVACPEEQAEPAGFLPVASIRVHEFSAALISAVNFPTRA